MFFKETPSTHPLTPNQVELINGRIHRWFGTVVSTRLLVTGVRRYLRVLVQTHCFFSFLSFIIYLLHTVCFPSDGADPQCRSLHTNHSHPCVCELQLLCFHVNTCVVKPICESTSASTDRHSVQRERQIVGHNCLCGYSMWLLGVWQWRCRGKLIN